MNKEDKLNYLIEHSINKNNKDVVHINNTITKEKIKEIKKKYCILDVYEHANERDLITGYTVKYYNIEKKRLSKSGIIVNVEYYDPLTRTNIKKILLYNRWVKGIWAIRPENYVIFIQMHKTTVKDKIFKELCREYINKNKIT